MAKGKQIDPENLRYNYLGFEYEPGDLKNFWKSEDEKKSFVDKIKSRLKGQHSIERDASVINAREMNPADRWVISGASFIMILSLFLPYYSFDAFGSSVSGSPLSYLINIGYVSNFVAWGNIVVKLSFIMSVLMIFISPALGVFNIISLNTGMNKPNYFSRLKFVGKLNVYAILAYLVMFILTALGQPNPFGSLGIEALGESLTLGTLIGLSSFSLWFNFGMHFLGSILASEL